MDAEEKKRKVLSKLNEFLKPLGVIGQLSRINEIDWKKEDGGKKGKEKEEDKEGRED